MKIEADMTPSRALGRDMDHPTIGIGIGGTDEEVSHGDAPYFNPASAAND